MFNPTLYFARDQKILEMCAEKRVLHLGCVGFVESAPEQRIALARDSLHFKLTQCCDVTGVDYSRNEIDFFRKNNVFDNVVQGNVENLEELSFECGQFEVIVVGDIIEHLSNPGLMLNGLRGILNEDTKVIVTTPSAFGLPNLMRFLLNRYREGNDHVLSFSAFTLTHLFRRHGYILSTFHTCYHVASSKERSLLFIVGKVILKLFPKWGGTLFCVFKLDPQRR